MKYFPGYEYIFNGLKSSNSGIFLLKGPKFSGKSSYCNHLFINAINDNSFCIYVSSSFTEKQYTNLFSSKTKYVEKNSKLVNPYLINQITLSDNLTDGKLHDTFLKIQELIDSHTNQSICFIMNSLTNLLTYFDIRDIIK
ncbi:MAG TPA: hypothetical protein VGC75_02815, partial [Candidatus Nitrosocosmicus sp.]